MDRATAAGGSRRRPWIPWAIGLLWAVALGLTVIAPGVLANRTAMMHRFWTSMPGIMDVFGTPTLLARLIPPGLAVVGVVLVFGLDASGRTRWLVRMAGVLLAGMLAAAVLQNVTTGPTCIVD